MTRKCIGCGAILQTFNPDKEGYVKEENLNKSVICERCFKIKNYGEYRIFNYDTNKYDEIFNNIKNTNDLVLYLCDILTLDDSLNNINKFKNAILVITKTDLLPKSVKDYKLLNYIKNNYKVSTNKIVFCSANKNYNLDLLMQIIYKNKKSNNIYLVGNTNAGKSTLINGLLKSYSNNDSYVTTSFLPATTLDCLNIRLNDNINLIDTPGIVSSDNYLYNEDVNVIKDLTSKKEIKPRTFQMKGNESIFIGDYARIDYLSEYKNSFTIYLSNSILVKRTKLKSNEKFKNYKPIVFDLDDNKDIVINGLCFLKITKKAKIFVYVKENVKVFERNNLI